MSDNELADARALAELEDLTLSQLVRRALVEKKKRHASKKDVDR